MVELNAASGQPGYYQPDPSMVLDGDGYYSNGTLRPSAAHPGYYEVDVADPTTPRLVFVPDGGGYPPGVDIVIENIGRAAYATLFRFAGGRQYEVRTAVMIPVAGALSKLDWEAPAGAVTYRAQLFDANKASIGYTAASTIQVVLEKSWAHNPLDPSGSVAVSFTGETGRAISRPSVGEVFFPTNRRLGVVVSGPRQGVRDLELEVVTDTLDDANRVRNLVGDYVETTVPVVCFRLASKERVRLPSPLFLSALDVVEKDRNYTYGGTQITHAIPGDEVSPPSPSLVIPLLTRADLDAAYSSRAARDADNTTRLRLDRRFDLIGRSAEGIVWKPPARKLLDARWPSRAAKDASSTSRSYADRPADMITHT